MRELRCRRKMWVGQMLLAAGAGLPGVGCGGESIEPPTTGSLAITAATTGPSPDPNGYTITLDGIDRGALVTGAATFDGLAPGNHQVSLSGIAANCQVQGDNPRTVTVTAGESVAVAFTIDCAALPPVSGSLEINTLTSGPSPDEDGYTVRVDSDAERAVGSNSSLTVSNLAAGTHTVTLSGLASNCAVQGDNPRNVTIVAGTATPVTFAISCGPPGVTQWTPIATGTSNDLRVVSGSSTNNVFVIDAIGAVRHYDGASWSLQVAPAPLKNVWTSSALRAFAVGGIRTLFSYDGQQWSPIDVPSARPSCRESGGYAEWIEAVWGSSETNVFAVGGYECEGRAGGSYILHYDGTSWSAPAAWFQEELTLTDVWGSSPTDVYAAGLYSPSTPGEYDPDDDRAQIIRYDGVGWSNVFSEAYLEVNQVWASGPSDVYAISQRIQRDGMPSANLLWHFNGNTWSTVDEMAGLPLAGIWGTSATDLYLLSGPDIWHFDGRTWTKVYTGENALADIWGSSSANVYVVGSNGTILHGTP